MDGEREAGNAEGLDDMIPGEQAAAPQPADAQQPTKGTRKPAKANARRGEAERGRTAKRPAAKRPAGSARGRDAKAKGAKGRAAANERIPRGAFKNLTPDRLRAHWELHHPDHPDVRSMLERLFRLPY